MNFKLPVINTFFQKKDEHLISYKSGKSATQVDYILCDHSMRGYFKDCKIVPGEPLTSQHRLLIGCLKMAAWNTKPKIKPRPRIKWYNLTKPAGKALSTDIDKYLCDLNCDQTDANDTWNLVHSHAIIAAKKHLGITKGKLNIGKEASWWSEEIKHNLENKKEAFKQWQGSKSDEDKANYKITKQIAKRSVAIARSEAQAELIERIETCPDDKELFKIAKSRNRQTQDFKRIKYINSSTGTLLTSDPEIVNRWYEYYQKLFNKEFPREQTIPLPHTLGPVKEVTIEEVKLALSGMKNAKATGPDELPAEFWKKLGPSGVTWLTVLFNKIIQGGKMPNMWRLSNLIPFYKNKGNVADCGNYRAIKLTSHALKIWERVLAKRLSSIANITPNQCGFRSGASTTDAIHAIRILMEKYKSLQRDLHLIFIDLEKAFDRVPRNLIWEALRAHNIPEQYIVLIQDMYTNITTQIVTPAGTSSQFEVGVGVHQGSALSPLLFNIVMNFVTEHLQKPAPWTLLYADDIVLIAESEMEIQADLSLWGKALESSGLRISRQKTEYMYCNFSGINQEGSISIDGTPVKRVTEFKYLGSILDTTANALNDIENRIRTGWLKWRALTGILCDPKIPVKTKGKV
ncbi:hypothetical protein O0L34_g9136 [Tuta absoluta]|nr:hypothetical protein O0L34_g9136 [Tuta absoluta]